MVRDTNDTVTENTYVQGMIMRGGNCKRATNHTMKRSDVGKFRQPIIQKAKKRGRRYPIGVSGLHPPQCIYTYEKNCLDRRIFHCIYCGEELHADVHAGCVVFKSSCVP